MSDSIDYLHNEVEKLRGSVWTNFNFLKSKLVIVVAVLVFLFILLFYFFPRKDFILQDSNSDKKISSRIEWRKFWILYIIIILMIGFFSTDIFSTFVREV